MDNPLRSRKAEWLLTLPSFVWLAVFFVIPAVIVLAFTSKSSRAPKAEGIPYDKGTR